MSGEQQRPSEAEDEHLPRHGPPGSRMSLQPQNQQGSPEGNSSKQKQATNQPTLQKGRKSACQDEGPRQRCSRPGLLPAGVWISEQSPASWGSPFRPGFLKWGEASAQGPPGPSIINEPGLKKKKAGRGRMRWTRLHSRENKEDAGSGEGGTGEPGRKCNFQVQRAYFA